MGMEAKHKTIAWELLADTLFKLPFPKHIYIEPTNDCRLNCSICPNKNTKSKTGYLDSGLFKKIINEIALFNNTKNITLHKNGEPLLHPELPKMITYIKKHLPSTEVSFSTSGVCLTEKISRKIIQAAPDKIFISYGNLSLDSEKDKIIKTASRNIKNFLAIRKKINKNRPRVALRFIDKKGDFRLIDAKRTRWQDLSDEIEIRPYHNWCGHFQRSYDIPKKGTPCLSLWTTLAINWDGDVSICSLDYAKQGIVGNVKKSTLKDIWQGKKLRFYRKKQLYNDYKNLKPCKNCTEWRHNVEFWTQENIKRAKVLSHCLA